MLYASIEQAAIVSLQRDKTLVFSRPLSLHQLSEACSGRVRHNSDGACRLRKGSPIMMHLLKAYRFNTEFRALSLWDLTGYEIAGHPDYNAEVDKVLAWMPFHKVHSRVMDIQF